MPEMRSFPFPVLSPDSMDYESDCTYEAEMQKLPNSAKVSITHTLKGGGLLRQLLCQGQAAFACIVSLPNTMYRSTEQCSAAAEQGTQIIDYGASGYGQEGVEIASPMFRPVIVAKRDIERRVTKADKLTALWDNVDIRMPYASILAFGEWARFGGNAGGLLKFLRDPQLNPGAMRVEQDPQNGFRFRVYVGEDLYNNIQEHVGSEHRRSVLTHALSAGLAILKQEYKNKDKAEWEEHVNLRLLADTLKQHDQGCWDEDDFNPELAATTLFPHEFPKLIDDSDD